MTDQIFIIRQLYQKIWEFDKVIYKLFVDFKKAYDSIHRELRKSDENKFLILERKILRKIFGPIKDDITGERRRRKNRKLQEMFNENNIAETIKKRRLRWI